MEKTNVMVEFRIIGNAYNINEITDCLEVLPSNTWEKGDIIEKNGKVRECTCWEYSTGYEETYDINSQLVKIYDIFYGKRHMLVKFKESYELEFKIDIVIRIENGEVPAVYLDKEMIEFANIIGAIYDFDMYIY